MNASRRKAIGKLIARLEGELRELVTELQEEGQEILDAEREWFDGKSEKWKETEDGRQADDQLTSLGAAVDQLDMNIDEIVGSLNDAQGEEA